MATPSCKSSDVVFRPSNDVPSAFASVSRTAPRHGAGWRAAGFCVGGRVHRAHLLSVLVHEYEQNVPTLDHTSGQQLDLGLPSGQSRGAPGPPLCGTEAAARRRPLPAVPGSGNRVGGQVAVRVCPAVHQPFPVCDLPASVFPFTGARATSPGPADHHVVVEHPHLLMWVFHQWAHRCRAGRRSTPAQATTSTSAEVRRSRRRSSPAEPVTRHGAGRPAVRMGASDRATGPRSRVLRWVRADWHGRPDGHIRAYRLKISRWRKNETFVA